MMTRYNKIIDGCSVTDIALGETWGEGAELYNYYLYVRPGGSGVIMRELTDQSEYRFYAFGNPEGLESVVNSEWDDRNTVTYKRTSEFKDL